MPAINLGDLNSWEPMEGFHGRFVHSDNMTFVYWEIDQGADLPEHSHPHEQVANVLEGRFDLVIDGETLQLGPGMVGMIPAGAIHSGRAVTDCRILDVFYPVREDYRQLTGGGKVTFDDIELAVAFVSSSPMGEHEAFLDTRTGKIYYFSEFGDSDEVPDEVLEAESTISLPHAKDLGLGSELAFEFVRSQLPEEFETVRDMFRRRGAYGRYKDFLDSRGLLEKWHNFENETKRRAIRKWCDQIGLDLAGGPAQPSSENG